MKNNKKNQKNTSSAKYLWALVAFLVISFLICCFLFWRKFQTPVSGKIIVLSSQTREDELPDRKFFEGRYLSFDYHSKYDKKNHQTVPNKGGIILESAFFSSAEAISQKFAMTVEDLKGRKIEDSGNFNLRKKNQEEYQEDNFSIEDTQGTIFTLNGPEYFEKSFFIPKNDFLVEFTFTGPLSDSEQISSEAVNLLKSINWKSNFEQEKTD